MIKLIFLDIDGVLAIPNPVNNTLPPEAKYGLCDTKQSLLKELLDNTGADIVISSSWRLPTVEETKKYLLKKGFKFVDKIVGVTIRGYHHIEKGFHMSIPRGVEIDQYIDMNIRSDNGKCFQIQKVYKDYNYIILDDDSDMLLKQKEHFVLINRETGISKENINMASLILNTKF